MVSRHFRALVESRYGDKLSDSAKTRLTAIGSKAFDDDGGSDFTDSVYDRRERDRERRELRLAGWSTREIDEHEQTYGDLPSSYGGSSYGGGSGGRSGPGLLGTTGAQLYPDDPETAERYDQMMREQRVSQTLDPDVEDSTGAGPMGILKWVGQGLDALARPSRATAFETADAMNAGKASLQDWLTRVSGNEVVGRVGSELALNIGGGAYGAARMAAQLGGTELDDEKFSVGGVRERMAFDDGWGEGFGNLEKLQMHEDDNVLEKFAKGTAALVGDVATDPLTYAGIGLVSQPGRKVGTEMTERAARQVVSRPANGLNPAKLGSDVAAEVVERGMGRQVGIGRAAQALRGTGDDLLGLSDDALSQGGDLLAQEIDNLSGTALQDALETLRRVDPDAYTSLVDDATAGAARNAYFEKGSFGLRQELGELSSKFGDDALSQDELFAQFPIQVQGGPQWRGGRYGRGMREVGAAERRVGGGKLLGENIMELSHAGRNRLRRLTPQLAEKLGGRWSVAYADAIRAIDTEEGPGQFVQYWRSLRDVDDRTNARVAAMFDRESAMRARQLDKLAEQTPNSVQARKAMDLYFLHRADPAKAKALAARRGIDPQSMADGRKMAEVLHEDMDRAYQELQRLYGNEMALNFINDYVPRIIKDEALEQRKQVGKKGSQTGASGWAPLAHRTGYGMKAELGDDGLLHSVWTAPDDLNRELGEQLFEEDSLVIASKYLSSMKNMTRQQMLYDGWREAGLIQETADRFGLRENMDPLSRRSSQAYRNRAAVMIDGVRRGLLGGDEERTAREWGQVLVEERGDPAGVEAAGRWLDKGTAERVGKTESGQVVYSQNGIDFWYDPSRRQWLVQASDPELYQEAGSKLREVEVRQARQRGREEVLELRDEEIKGPQYDRYHAELAEALEGGDILSPTDLRNGLSVDPETSQSSYASHLTYWQKNAGVDPEDLPEQYRRRPLGQQVEDMERQVVVRGTGGRRPVGGFATRTVNGEKEVLVPFGTESRPVMEAMIRDGATLAQVPESMVERFRVFGWAPREAVADEGMVSMRLDPQQALGYRTIEDARAREQAWLTGPVRDLPSDIQANDLPLPPGETPLPTGQSRAFHWTTPENAERIRSEGLRADEASELGGGGVWLSGDATGWGSEGQGRVLIEVSLDDTLEPVNGSLGSTFQIAQDVPPDRIIGVHRDWHGRYRYLKEEGLEDEVLAGEFDDLLDVPQYGPAIRRIKEEAGRGTPAPAEPQSLQEMAENLAGEVNETVTLYRGVGSRQMEGGPTAESGRWFTPDRDMALRLYAGGDPSRLRTVDVDVNDLAGFEHRPPGATAGGGFNELDEYVVDQATAARATPEGQPDLPDLSEANDPSVQRAADQYLADQGSPGAAAALARDAEVTRESLAENARELGEELTDEELDERTVQFLTGEGADEAAVREALAEPERVGDYDPKLHVDAVVDDWSTVRLGSKQEEALWSLPAMSTKTPRYGEAFPTPHSELGDVDYARWQVAVGTMDEDEVAELLADQSLTASQRKSALRGWQRLRDAVQTADPDLVDAPAPRQAAQAAPESAEIAAESAEALELIDYVLDDPTLMPAERMSAARGAVETTETALRDVARARGLDPDEFVAENLPADMGPREALDKARMALRNSQQPKDVEGVPDVIVREAGLDTPGPAAPKLDSTGAPQAAPRPAVPTLEDFARTPSERQLTARTGDPVRNREVLEDVGPKGFDTLEEAEAALGELFPMQTAARTQAEQAAQLDRVVNQMLDDEDLLRRAFDENTMPPEGPDRDEYIEGVVAALSRQLELNPEQAAKARKDIFTPKLGKGYRDDVVKLTNGDWQAAWTDDNVRGALARRFEQTGAIGPKSLIRGLAEEQRLMSGAGKITSNVWDPLYAFWKARVTASSLRSIGFAIRNAQGGMYNAWLQGARPRHFSQAAASMLAAERAERGALNRLGVGATAQAVEEMRGRLMVDELMNLRGTKMSREEAQRLADAYQAFHALNLHSATRVDDLNRGRFNASTSREGLGRHNKNVDRDTARALADFADGGTLTGRSRQEQWAAMRGEGGETVGQRGAAALGNAAQARLDNRFSGRMRSANQDLEHYLRLGAFLKGVDDWGLEDGGVGASLIVRQSQFDYSDLSPWEQRIRSGIWGMPFYSWIRNNLPLQTRMAAADPGKLNAALRGMETVQNVFGADPEDRIGEDPADGSVMPEWVRDSFGFETSMGDWAARVGLGDRMAGTATARVDLPIQDLNRWIERAPSHSSGLLGTGFQADIHEGIGGLSPFLKGGVEAGLGISTFTKGPLPETEASWWAKGIERLPFVSGATFMEDGVEMVNPYLANWVQQVEPDIGAIDRATGATPRYRERQLSSIASMLGVPLATSTGRQLRGEMYGRTGELWEQQERMAGPFQDATLQQIEQILEETDDPGDARRRAERLGILEARP